MELVQDCRIWLCSWTWHSGYPSQGPQCEQDPIESCNRHQEKWVHSIPESPAQVGLPWREAYTWTISNIVTLGKSLAVCVFIAEGLGSIFGQGIKIPQAMWCSQKKKYLSLCPLIWGRWPTLSCLLKNVAIAIIFSFSWTVSVSHSDGSAHNLPY